ncbi:phage tail tip protein, partial [Escherichia coli]
APTITSGGNPPAFSLTPDGKLTAKNADISGSVNANAGTLNNVTINESCTIKGMLDANQVRGDFVKTTGHRFPHPGEYPQGSLTVHIKDDHAFDRQIIILPIMYGAPPYFSKKYDANIYDTCRLIVRKNGNVIYDKSTSGSKRTTVVYSNIIDMPVGDGDVILTFEVQSSGSGEPRTW